VQHVQLLENFAIFFRFSVTSNFTAHVDMYEALNIYI